MIKHDHPLRFDLPDFVDLLELVLAFSVGAGAGVLGFACDSGLGVLVFPASDAGVAAEPAGAFESGAVLPLLSEFDDAESLAAFLSASAALVYDSDR